jgi:hypothetical protein
MRRWWRRNRWHKVSAVIAAGWQEGLMDPLSITLYCAVDREPIETHTFLAMTVNALTRDVVTLTFCLDHRKEWEQMREIVRQEGWR